MILPRTKNISSQFLLSSINFPQLPCFPPRGGLFINLYTACAVHMKGVEGANNGDEASETRARVQEAMRSISCFIFFAGIQRY